MLKKNLSKSQYTKGLQCGKALWLYRHRKDLRTEPEAFQESIMEAGTEFGELARKRWPGGVLITADHMHPEDALAQTKAALEAGATTLYEAAFLYDEVLVRVDVLERVGPPSAGNLWSLTEVKSGTKVEETHLRDVAVQLHVLAGAGHKIVEAAVAHANPAYVRRGALDLAALFHVESVTKEVRDYLGLVPADLALMKQYADAETAPAAAIGDRCKKPYPCEFKAHCWAGVPKYSVFDIPYLKNEKKLELYARGVQHVHQVNPDIAKITDKRSLRAIETAKLGKIKVDVGEIRGWLSSLMYPLAHMDFETENPVVPPYDGLRPYSQMPFQASIRVQQEMGGEVVEHGFLGDGLSDPRKALGEFLCDMLPKRGSVLAYYKPFESGRLVEMVESGILKPTANHFLMGIARGLHDLADPFSKGWYSHPEFNGRWSIKAVLPALCPDMSYKTLLIQDGGQAMAAYAELRDPKMPPARRKELSDGLKAYCGQDTEAMVRILAHLYEVGKVPA